MHKLTYKIHSRISHQYFAHTENVSILPTDARQDEKSMMVKRATMFK